MLVMVALLVRRLSGCNGGVVGIGVILRVMFGGVVHVLLVIT